MERAGALWSEVAGPKVGRQVARDGAPYAFETLLTKLEQAQFDEKTRATQRAASVELVGRKPRRGSMMARAFGGRAHSSEEEAERERRKDAMQSEHD